MVVDIQNVNWKANTVVKEDVVVFNIVKINIVEDTFYHHNIVVEKIDKISIEVVDDYL